ncbi:hypothetical protein F3087_32630 [Nocardia colli]|uniref:Uncharacterized protein n=1 Tax=Nocardia colli TaxID=2545717 RepID=A0A5N0E982_9NOCA|nr:hypothetical protein [Nocardia colli]KAA8884724.1 hypothetical protein F3087_32630 [Nocardia colli]
MVGSRDPAGFAGTPPLDMFFSVVGGAVKNGVDWLLKNGLGVAQWPVLAASEIMNAYQPAGVAAGQNPDGKIGRYRSRSIPRHRATTNPRRQIALAAEVFSRHTSRFPTAGCRTARIDRR